MIPGGQGLEGEIPPNGVCTPMSLAGTHHQCLMTKGSIYVVLTDRLQLPKIPASKGIV